jgi:hypothetical protein
MTGIGIFMTLHGLGIIRECVQALREVTRTSGQLIFLPQGTDSLLGLVIGIVLIICAFGLFLKRRLAYGMTCAVSALMVVYTVGGIGYLLIGLGRDVPFSVYLVMAGLAVIYGLTFRSVRAEWLKGREA